MLNSQFKRLLPFQGRLFNLATDGRLEQLEPVLKGVLGLGAVVVLSRQRCIFAAYSPPKGVTGSAALAAARLFATANAPFAQSGQQICRKGEQFGIWWWDSAWAVEALATAGLHETVTILPEPLVQQPGLGARLLRSGAGFEAQYWRDGFLVGTHWTLSPYSDGAWQDFLREFPDQDSLEPLPPLSSVVRAPDNRYLKSLVSGQIWEVSGRLGLAAGAICLVAFTGFFLGQALRLDLQIRKADAQIEALQASDDPGAKANLKRELNAVVQSERFFVRTSPADLMQKAQKVILPFKYKLTDFESDGKQVSFSLPEEASAGVDILTEELEKSKDFAQVTPVFDKARRRVVFTMTVQAAGRGE